MEEHELIHIVADLTPLPQELQTDIEKINMLDLNSFNNEIDPERQSFKCFNSLNQFKYDFEGEIKIQNELTSKVRPLNGQDFSRLINKYGMHKIQSEVMFGDDFTFDKIFGK